MEDRYWPFPVLPPEQQTPLHKQQISFLEAAYHEGFRPFVFMSDNYQATASSRGGIIIRRTRQFWEVSLGTPDRECLGAFVDTFAVVGEAVLRWLRGAQAQDILEFVRPHLVPLSTGYRVSDTDKGQKMPTDPTSIGEHSSG